MKFAPLVYKLESVVYVYMYTLIEKDHLGDWSPEKDCC